MKINSISAKAADCPDRLRSIPDSPGQIYVLGHMPDYRVGVAIVGTRKPTAYGRQVTSAIAEQLAERGAVVVSGLAYGVDAIAHEAVVKAGGRGIAVLAGGVDKIYPSGHHDLAARLLDTGGAVLSDQPPGTPHMQHLFLARNRLVSGLSDAIVVTEAGLRSGTMNTVRHALEQGRDVYAVPGPITSPMSAGTNALIGQGATPITDIELFVNDLLPKSSPKQAALLAQTEHEQVVIDLLQAGVSDGDELSANSKLATAEFMTAMTMLEIRGVIRPLGGNHWGL